MKKIKLLFVDDEKLNCTFFREYLIPLLNKCDSYQLVAITCHNFIEATKILTTSDFAIIISDFDLKEEKNGIDIYHYLRSKKMLSPFILFTASTSELDKIPISDDNFFKCTNKNWPGLRTLLQQLLARI